MGEDLVWFALDQLRKEDLVTGNEEAPAQFDGLSRREVVKKIGYGSMVALPIVAAIIAPTAAHAQSCVGAMGPTCFAPGTALCQGMCDTFCGFCNGTGTLGGTPPLCNGSATGCTCTCT